jgi:hypothetical protein
MKSFRLKSRKHSKSRKGGNGRSSSSSSSSENYTNEKFKELIRLLSEFELMSDEDLANNTFGFNARKLERYIDERNETVDEIKGILTNPNFNIALLPNDKTASLLTAIVSANDEIIDLYTNLYATKENPPQIDEVLNRVKFTFKMDTNSYDDDDDDSNSDSERENKEKSTSIANEKYDKLISIIKKMKGKRTRDDSSSNSSNKYSRRNEDTDDDDDDNYNNDDDDVDMADLNTVFNNLKSKGGRRTRKLRGRKLRGRKLKGHKLRRTNRRK